MTSLRLLDTIAASDRAPIALLLRTSGVASTSRRGGATRRGTAATELALVLPLLVLSTLLCCDFSRVMQHRAVVANAARSAAQSGAMSQYTDYTYADWERRVRACAEDELHCLRAVDSEEALIVPSSYSDSRGYRCIAVDVELPFETVIHWGVIPKTIPIHYRAEFRQFR